MNENTSLFSHAEPQIQLHAPASVIPQNLPAPALQDSCAKLIKKTSRSARKVKNNQGLTAGCGGFGGGTLLDSVKREG